jgi:hypothetical protein
MPYLQLFGLSRWHRRVAKNGLKDRIGTLFKLIWEVAYLGYLRSWIDAGLTVYSEVVLLLQ